MYTQVEVLDHKELEGYPIGISLKDLLLLMTIRITYSNSVYC